MYDVIVHQSKQWRHRTNFQGYVPLYPVKMPQQLFWSRLREVWCNTSDSWRLPSIIYAKKLRLKSKVLGKIRTAVPSDKNFTKRTFFHWASWPRQINLLNNIKLFILVPNSRTWLPKNNLNLTQDKSDDTIHFNSPVEYTLNTQMFLKYIFG